MALAPQQSLQSVFERFNRLTNRRKVSLMVGMAAAIAVAFGGWSWLTASQYRVLYSNLSDKDGGAVIAALQQANVPYRMSEGGAAILVPEPQVHEVRLRLASQGLPKGSVVGFELMEAQRLGISQFLEQVNYQRALEGELTRSIESLSAVQAARVHLAIPKPSVFVREKIQPSASVVLSLYPGRVLDAVQIAGITHLIASSVPELSARYVTIVDQTGNLISQVAEGAEPGLDAGQLKYLAQVEAGYVQRIESILLPVVGAGNVRAQVTAELDFSQVEQTAETFKPNTDPTESAIRSQQSSESVGGGGAGAAGIPGALSNQPPGAATAPLTAPGAAAGGQAGVAPVTPSSRQSTTNYELDKTIKHVKQATGSLRRLSAAVVVNHKRITAEDGKASFVALNTQEVEQITRLVREAIGFSEQRGDTLNVVNLPFAGAEILPEVPLWQRPQVIAAGAEIGKYALVAVVFLVFVMGVIRPILRDLLAPSAPREPGMPGMEPGIAAEAAAPVAGPAGAARADSVEAARELARQDPKVVANVVKQWLNQ